MLLVDTSVWIDHFRQYDARLGDALEAGEVLTHPFVIGELACGHLKRRETVLGLLEQLPSAKSAEHEELLGLVESAGLKGTGIGWMDAHLLASALLSGSDLWTKDAALQRAWAVLKKRPTRGVRP
jgi:predicted nucleic acid-binding protein